MSMSYPVDQFVRQMQRLEEHGHVDGQILVKSGKKGQTLLYKLYCICLTVNLIQKDPFYHR